MPTKNGKGCIFCGGTPLTKEHLWPAWMQRAFAIKDGFAHRHQTEVNGIETRDIAFETPPLTLVVKSVCGPCNNGWMSEMEAAAKPILEPLLRFSGRRLHRREQRTLANWALLKAIVLDETHPDSRAILPEHADYLYRHHTLPDSGCWAWMATYNVEQELVHYAYQGLQLTEPDSTQQPEFPTAYVVTLSAGPVVFQIAGTSLPDLSWEGVVFPQIDAVTLWPTSSSVEYRQRVAMNTSTLKVFSTTLYDYLLQRSSPKGPNAV